MSSYGVNTPNFNLSATMGRIPGIIAGNPERARQKVVGITLDWSKVAPVLVDTTIATTGQVIKAGQKYIRYGTSLHRLTTGGKYAPFSAALTANTLNGAVVAGALSIVVNAITGAINPGDTLHIAAGGGTAEDVVVQSRSGTTVTLQAGLGFAHADTTAVTKVSNGQELLNRGQAFLLPHTIVDSEIMSDHPSGVFDGGCAVYVERVASDVSGGVTTNPTKAQLETLYPTLTWVIE